MCERWKNCRRVMTLPYLKGWLGLGAKWGSHYLVLLGLALWKLLYFVRFSMAFSEYGLDTRLL